MDNLRYFKVYSKSCISAVPIKEIFKNDVYNLISDSMEYTFNNLDFSSDDDFVFSDVFEEFISKLDAHILDNCIDFFDKNHFIECGDFAIYAVNDKSDIDRKNAYSYSRCFHAENYKSFSDDLIKNLYNS